MLIEMISKIGIQLGLFSYAEDHPCGALFTKTLDTINRCYGKFTLGIGVFGDGKSA